MLISRFEEEILKLLSQYRYEFVEAESNFESHKYKCEVGEVTHDIVIESRWKTAKVYDFYDEDSWKPRCKQLKFTESEKFFEYLKKIAEECAEKVFVEENMHNKNVRVAVIYEIGKKPNPIWFDLEGEQVKIDEVTYFWQSMHGSSQLNHYSIQTGKGLFELVLDTKEQTWQLKPGVKDK